MAIFNSFQHFVESGNISSQSQRIGSQRSKHRHQAGKGVSFDWFEGAKEKWDLQVYPGWYLQCWAAEWTSGVAWLLFHTVGAVNPWYYLRPSCCRLSRIYQVCLWLRSFMDVDAIQGSWMTPNVWSFVAAFRMIYVLDWHRSSMSMVDASWLVARKKGLRWSEMGWTVVRCGEDQFRELKSIMDKLQDISELFCQVAMSRVARKE